MCSRAPGSPGPTWAAIKESNSSSASTIFSEDDVHADQPRKATHVTPSRKRKADIHLSPSQKKPLKLRKLVGTRNMQGLSDAPIMSLSKSPVVVVQHHASPSLLRRESPIAKHPSRNSTIPRRNLRSPSPSVYAVTQPVFSKVAHRPSLTQPISTAKTRIKRTKKGKGKVLSSRSSSELPDGILWDFRTAGGKQKHASTTSAKGMSRVLPRPSEPESSRHLNSTKSSSTILSSQTTGKVGRLDISAPEVIAISSDDEALCRPLSSRGIRPSFTTLPQSSIFTTVSGEIFEISSDEDQRSKGVTPTEGSSSKPKVHSSNPPKLRCGFTSFTGSGRIPDDIVIDLESDDELLPQSPSNGQMSTPQRVDCSQMFRPNISRRFPALRGSSSNPNNLGPLDVPELGVPIKGFVINRNPDDDLPDPLDLLANSNDAPPLRNAVKSFWIESQIQNPDVSIASNSPVLLDFPLRDETDEATSLPTAKALPPVSPECGYDPPGIEPHMLAPIEQRGREPEHIPLSKQIAMLNLTPEVVDLNTNDNAIDTALPPPSCRSLPMTPELESHVSNPTEPPPQGVRPTPVDVSGPYVLTDSLWDFAYRRVQRQMSENGLPSVHHVETITDKAVKIEHVGPHGQDEALLSSISESFPKTSGNTLMRSPLHAPIVEAQLRISIAEGDRTIPNQQITNSAKIRDSSPVNASAPTGRPVLHSLTDVINRTRMEYFTNVKAQSPDSHSPPSGSDVMDFSVKNDEYRPSGLAEAMFSAHKLAVLLSADNQQLDDHGPLQRTPTAPERSNADLPNPRSDNSPSPKIGRSLNEIRSIRKRLGRRSVPEKDSASGMSFTFSSNPSLAQQGPTASFLATRQSGPPFGEGEGNSQIFVSTQQSPRLPAPNFTPEKIEIYSPFPSENPTMETSHGVNLTFLTPPLSQPEDITMKVVEPSHEDNFDVVDSSRRGFPHKTILPLIEDRGGALNTFSELTAEADFVQDKQLRTDVDSDEHDILTYPDDEQLFAIASSSGHASVENLEESFLNGFTGEVSSRTSSRSSLQRPSREMSCSSSRSCLYPISGYTPEPRSIPGLGNYTLAGTQSDMGGLHIITWQDIRAATRKLKPRHLLARDLPHTLQDHMNAMDSYWRSLPMSRTIFEAAISENTMDDEPDAPPIRIINNIDDEPTPPWEFHYTNQMWHGEGVPGPDVVNLSSCDCEGTCDPKSKTCACLKRQQSFTLEFSPDFAYDRRGRLKQNDIPIFECNDLCGCGNECRNRIVQQGRKCMVNIGKTKEKGWGVFAGHKRIPSGTYVGIYAGELLTDAVSEQRGLTYNSCGRTYLFDIDHHHLRKAAGDNWETKYVVDAYHAGNFTRFLNHSCDPNCTLNACYINDSNFDKPLLTVFTQRDVEPGEELCFSYSGPPNEEELDEEGRLSLTRNQPSDAVFMACQCEAPNCTGIMFK